MSADLSLLLKKGETQFVCTAASTSSAFGTLALGVGALSFGLNVTPGVISVFSGVFFSLNAAAPFLIAGVLGVITLTLIATSIYFCVSYQRTKKQIIERILEGELSSQELASVPDKIWAEIQSSPEDLEAALQSPQVEVKSILVGRDPTLYERLPAELQDSPEFAVQLVQQGVSQALLDQMVGRLSRGGIGNEAEHPFLSEPTIAAHLVGRDPSLYDQVSPELRKSSAWTVQLLRTKSFTEVERVIEQINSSEMDGEPVEHMYDCYELMLSLLRHSPDLYEQLSDRLQQNTNLIYALLQEKRFTVLTHLPEDSSLLTNEFFIISVLFLLDHPEVHLAREARTQFINAMDPSQLTENRRQDLDRLKTSRGRLGRLIRLERATLHNCPRRALLLLIPYLEAGRIPKIAFTNEQGVDGGGLTRDFVTTLFASLFPSREFRGLYGEGENEHPLNRLSFFQGESGCLPQVTHTKDLEYYRLFGQLFGVLLTNNPGRARIGPIFSPLLFQVLQACTPQEMQTMGDWDGIPTKTKMKMYAELTDFATENGRMNDYLRRYVGEEELTSADRICFQSMIELYLEDDEEETIPDPDQIDFKKFEQVFLIKLSEESDNLQILQGIAALAHAFAGHSENCCERLGTLTPLELERSIQGQLSAEQLKRQIHYPRGRIGRRTRRMLEMWIDNASEDLDKLSLFVQAVTGSPSLTGGVRLRVNCFSGGRAAERFPIGHTCMRRVDLPDYPDQETFNEKMDYFVSSALGGFNYL